MENLRRRQLLRGNQSINQSIAYCTSSCIDRSAHGITDFIDLIDYVYRVVFVALFVNNNSFVSRHGKPIVCMCMYMYVCMCIQNKPRMRWDRNSIAADTNTNNNNGVDQYIQELIMLLLLLLMVLLYNDAIAIRKMILQIRIMNESVVAGFPLLAS